MVFFAAGFGVLALVDELIGTAFAVILLGLGGTVVLTTNMSLMASSGLPDGDRNQRLSMLQMSTPLGQFIGLLIIALLIQLGLEFSGLFWVMAALAVVGLILTALTAGPAEQRARDAQASASPADAGEEAAPQMGLGAVLLTSFGLLLLVVAVWFSAHTILLSQYANLMKNVFSIDNNTAAVGMAVAVLVSIPLFPLVGRWLATAPYRLPLLVGIGLQTLAALGLWLISGMTGIPALVPLAIYGVIMLMLTLNDVSGAVLSTSTSPIGPSSGQGGYGFAMALGGILGAILAGLAADWLGFSGLPLVAAIGFGVAFVLALLLPRVRAASSA
jgi:predicted MFS family arabinose efflux permease